MSYLKGGYVRESLQDAGYQEVAVLEDGLHLLEDTETGKQEIWAESLHFAGCALISGDTELEFVRDAMPHDLS
jgi:hypothetical protein